jgi:hypothetical protein
VSRRELSHGELAAALRTLAAERYLPPGSKTLRYFGVSTFERWLYAYREHGLAGLRPAPRSDRGRARDLTPEQRELLLRRHGAPDAIYLDNGSTYRGEALRLCCERGTRHRRAGSGPRRPPAA